MLLEYVVVHVTLDENDTISFKMGLVDDNQCFQIPAKALDIPGLDVKTSPVAPG